MDKEIFYVLLFLGFNLFIGYKLASLVERIKRKKKREEDFYGKIDNHKKGRRK